MLVIRESQIRAFQEAAERRLEEELLASIRASAPRHVEVLGEPATRATIRLGYARSVAYGFDRRSDVLMYVSLMLTLGSGFDADPLLPFAGATLNSLDPPRPSARLHKLAERAREHVTAVFGADDRHHLDAIDAFRTEPIDALSRAPAAAPRRVLRSALQRLQPVKCNIAGEALLERWIGYGIETAKRRGILSERGLWIYVGLMFLLGSGFDADPRLPWAEEAIRDHAGEPEGMAGALHAAALTHFAAWTDEPAPKG